MTERLRIAQSVLGCKLDNQNTGTQFLAGTNISIFSIPSIMAMGPKRLLSTSTARPFTDRSSSQGMKLTTILHLLLRLIMQAAKPQLPHIPSHYGV